MNAEKRVHRYDDVFGIGGPFFVSVGLEDLDAFRFDDAERRCHSRGHHARLGLEYVVVRPDEFFRCTSCTIIPKHDWTRRLLDSVHRASSERADAVRAERIIPAIQLDVAAGHRGPEPQCRESSRTPKRPSTRPSRARR